MGTSYMDTFDGDTIRHMATKKRVFKPGQKVPVSAQYAKIGPSRHKTKKEITSIKGKKFPPAPKSGMKYKLSDRTKHKK